ncbi:MAG: VOC family protein [Sulfobacillus sp.]
MTVKIERVAQVGVRVHDVQRAVAFYRDVLELPLLFSAPRLAFFQCGETRLFLSLSEAPRFDHPASIIYYQVADLDQAYAGLQARGVAFEDAPHEVGRLGDRAVWMAFFPDPEGNLLAITSERPLN